MRNFARFLFWPPKTKINFKLSKDEIGANMDKDDTRNSRWSMQDTYGKKLMRNMGWNDGEGLGKELNGITTNLRSVRRADELGIGATVDHQSKGWCETVGGFNAVLDSLNDKYSITGKKKRKRDNLIMKNLNSEVLSSKQVQVGHAKKMRLSKDLSTKSEADLAAIFGRRKPVKEKKNKKKKLPT